MTDEEGTPPKHLAARRSRSSMSHCCFSGCTPMGCPGGCCANIGWHESHCPLNPGNQLADAQHDAYVAAGMRKHLRQPDEPHYTPSLDWGALPPLRPAGSET